MNTNIDFLNQIIYTRLAALLGETHSSREPILLHLGEPKLPPPLMVKEIISDHAALWGKYPPIHGTQNLRDALFFWIKHRYPDSQAVYDILPVAGTREGLFSISFFAKFLFAGSEQSEHKHYIAFPDPFYHVYRTASCYPRETYSIPIPAPDSETFCQNIFNLPPETLHRLALIYICSPSNPTGSVLSLQRITELQQLAAQYNFFIAFDECYSEIYPLTAPPPPGALESALFSEGRSFVFNSLSKRSSVPGLRSGFVASTPSMIKTLENFRNSASPQVPLPIMEASAALWRDEHHVQRSFYQQSFQAVSDIFPDLPLPQGGFFLWMNVHEDGREFCQRLWKNYAVKCIPGSYFSTISHYDTFIRIAIVHNAEKTRDALTCIQNCMNNKS